MIEGVGDARGSEVVGPMPGPVAGGICVGRLAEGKCELHWRGFTLSGRDAREGRPARALLPVSRLASRTARSKSQW